MIDSLYGDLPPPQFSDNDNTKPTLFINDAIKPLLKPIQKATSSNNKLISHNNPVQLQNYVPNQLNHVSLQAKLQIKDDYFPNNLHLTNYSECNDDESTVNNKSLETLDDNLSDDEDYNPGCPNSYDEYINEKQIKRKILENKLIPRNDIDLNISGEEAWKRRAKMSDPSSLPINNEFTSGNKKNLATRLMEKMGWKAGEGLGKDKQGIKTPLIAKKVAQNSAIITTLDPIFNVNTKVQASRILCIKSSDAIPLDIVEDESSKHGSLISIKPHNSNDCLIFLEFETEKQGTNCYKNMNNTTLNGKLLSVYYYPVDEFNNDNLDYKLS